MKKEMDQIGQIGGLTSWDEALKASEEKYRALLDFSPDAFFQADSQGNIVTTNKKAVELTWFSTAELLSMKLEDIFPTSLLNDRTVKDNDLKSDHNVPSEGIILRKDGEIIQMEMNSRTMPDGTCQCFVRDVTQRRRAEEKLLESEEKHRMLLDESSDPIFTFYPDGQYRYVNKAFSDGVGKKLEDIIGKKIWDVFPKEEADKRFAAVKWVFENGEEKVIEVRVPVPGGSQWYLTTVKPIWNDQGKIITVICISKNITGRKRAEELLKGSEEKFRQLIENSFDIIVLLDADGIQRFVSDSCEKILGYRPDELTNIPVIDHMIHPDDHDEVKKALQMAAHLNYGSAEYRHRHKNGGWVYLEAFGSNQLDNPSIQSFVLNVRDITARKQTEEALRESEARLNQLNATKDKFFSIIAHDLRSPFNSIMGFSNLLEDQIQQKNYQGIEEYAAIIQKSSNRALALLQNLLEWARSQTGSMVFKPEIVEIVALMKEVTDLLNDSANQKAISISMSIPPLAIVLADREMMGTTLRNLLSNAIKFTNSGGEIVLSVQQKNDEWMVTVTDNGVGIQKETIEKLFHIDQSYTTAGTQNERGTGLGLILCKEFVEKHGGRIWVESQVMKGSKFCFTIPA